MIMQVDSMVFPLYVAHDDHESADDKGPPILDVVDPSHAVDGPAIVNAEIRPSPKYVKTG